ncbi:hypothetical protein HDV05_002259 [Chytridiales sp. JEL 0842]|nr:hypothetical protein HDV05_002259 [Chytridiales sp. JEL 0842]
MAVANHHRVRTTLPLGRDQIPRLSRFVSVLFFHVWASNSLPQTLEKGEGNPLFITFVKNVLEITAIPLPVITLAIKYVQRLRRQRVRFSSSSTLSTTATSSSSSSSSSVSSTSTTTATNPSSTSFSTPSFPSPNFPLSQTPEDDMAKVFSVALMLAQKYSDDAPYGNRIWGQVLGLGAFELSKLERGFLESLGFELYVTETEYGAFCKGVQALAREWNKHLAGVKVFTEPSLAVTSTKLSPKLPQQQQTQQQLPPLSPLSEASSSPSRPPQLPSPSDSPKKPPKRPPTKIDTTNLSNPKRRSVDINGVPTHSHSTCPDPTTDVPPPLSGGLQTPLPADGPSPLVPSTLDAFLNIAQKTYGLHLVPCQAPSVIRPAPSLLSDTNTNYIPRAVLPQAVNMDESSFIYSSASTAAVGALLMNGRNGRG